MIKGQRPHAAEGNIMKINDLTGYTPNTFNMDFGERLVRRHVARSRGNLPIHSSLFIHGSNRSIGGLRKNSKPAGDNLNWLPQRLFFYKVRLEQISMDGQTVHFLLNTISSSSKAITKKNGKRGTLAPWD